MWRLAVLIVAAIVVLSIIGFVIDLLQTLLWIGLVVGAIALVVGWVVDKSDRTGR